MTYLFLPSVDSAPALEGGGGEVVEVEGGVVLAGDPRHRGQARHGRHHQTYLHHYIIPSQSSHSDF